VSGDRVRVWWTELGAGDPAVLSGDELARAGRFRDSDDRRRFVAGRCWLRTMLASLVGAEPDALHFEYAAMGKPVLAARTDLEFNLSHSGDVAVLAAGRSGPVGIDIERIRPGAYDRSAAALVLSGAELDHIEASSHPDAAFASVWTRKEAYAKVGGSGLDRSLAELTLGDRTESRVDGITVRSLDIGLDRIACAVATGTGGGIELAGRT